MGKVTITLTDMDNGNVGVVFDPPASELFTRVKRLLDERQNVPAILGYALECRKAINKYSAESARMAKEADRFEADRDARLILPAYDNVTNKIDGSV